MPIESVPALVQLLDQYHLLEPLQYHELTTSLQANFSEPLPLTRELVQRGWLTPYQVNHLFQGKEKQLTLGSYVLQEKISEGVMGDVFKARHVHMRRIVALQVIRPDLLRNPEAVERFYTEVQASSQLSHTHLVASFDAGPIGDTHFFAMEFIEGIDLERHVEASGPLPVIQACEFVRQAALGLQHAFQRGLRHHDVKPSNLLLAESRGGGDGRTPTTTSLGVLTWGLVKVRNLGLTIIRQPTKHTRLEMGRPRQNTGFCSPDYVAPERAGGQPGDIRSEVYSLGCTFYFLLTGQVPFPGGTVEDKHRRHCEETPVPLEAHRPAVPAEVRALVLRMMAKQPEARLATPNDVALALAALPAHALTASAAEGKAWELRRAAEQRRSRRLIVGGGVGLAVCLLLFAVLLTVKLGGGGGPSETGPAEKPVTVVPVPASKPALALYCGRADGWPVLEAVTPGYGYRPIQGTNNGGWGADPNKTYCWADGLVRFAVIVPKETAGELHVFCVDGDNLKRRQSVTLLTRPPKSQIMEGFAGKGEEVRFPVSKSDTAQGQVEISVKKLDGPNAVISHVEFYPLVNPDAPAATGPALVIQCGRGGENNQDEVIVKGYSWKRENAEVSESWASNAVKNHAWLHGDKIIFRLRMPPGTVGKVRLLLSDPDQANGGRKVRVLIEDKPINKEFADYSGPAGGWREFSLSAADTRSGEVKVTLENLNKATKAVVSTIEFVPQ